MEHENFPVYKLALDLIDDITAICKRITTQDFLFIKDQLMRASSSIVLNIAEGAGKWTKRDKINFYRISRGSAYECRAALDLLVRYKIIDNETASKLKDKLYAVSCGLDNLMASISKRRI